MDDLVLRALAIPLKAPQKPILVELARRAGSDGCCEPSAPDVAFATGYSSRSVQRVLAELVAAGYLARKKRTGRSWPVRVLPPDGWQFESPPTESHPRQPVTPGVTESHPRGDGGSPLTESHPRQPVTPDSLSPLTESHPPPPTESHPRGDGESPLTESHPRLSVTPPAGPDLLVVPSSYEEGRESAGVRAPAREAGARPPAAGGSLSRGPLWVEDPTDPDGRRGWTWGPDHEQAASAWARLTKRSPRGHQRHHPVGGQAAMKALTPGEQAVVCQLLAGRAPGDPTFTVQQVLEVMADVAGGGHRDLTYVRDRLLAPKPGGRPSAPPSSAHPGQMDAYWAQRKREVEAEAQRRPALTQEELEGIECPV